MASQDPIVLSFLSARRYEVQALILVRSLRQFGGGMADLPVWIYELEGQPMEGPALAALKELNVEIIPLPMGENLRKFPFAAKTVAAAAAEARAEKAGLILARHDRTGFIRHAPEAFHLPGGKTFGFRPTDIANIGAPFGQPLPPFWEAILAHFNLSPDQFPPITTVIDQQTLHLYVNAGVLVTRPEKGTFRAWADNLKTTCARPAFRKFYAEKQAYAIFMHQAALTAAVVQTTRPEERFLLPDSYLFSVDNFFDYPESARPASLDAITTGRFHEFFGLNNWQDKVIASEDLLNWFRAQLALGPYWPEA